MQFSGEKIIYSASDLTDFLACEHLTRLNLAVVRKELSCPTVASPDLDILTHRGKQHENQYLKDLREQGFDIVEIENEPGREGFLAAANRTLEAMKHGVDIIYQATFFDGQWLGRSDFLRRVDIPSGLGPFSYEAEDTKLAKKVKATALMQLCAYSEQLGCLQDLQPEKMHVILGDKTRSSFLLKDYGAYYRKIKSLFLEMVSDANSATYPHPVEHCAVCQWQEFCEQQLRQEDALYLVAGINRTQVKKLANKEITTLAQLAGLPLETKVQGIGQPVLQKLIQQARLQLEKRQHGKNQYELLPADKSDRGLALLPPPTEDDIFFDIEGDPYAEEAGLEYLLGVVAKIDGKLAFQPFWAHTPVEEKRAFENFIDFVFQRLAQNPHLHIYHYASYEQTAIKKLMGIHGTREEEVDRLFRGGVFVDLYTVVRQGIRVSEESYSLKKIEQFYDVGRKEEIKDAASSIVAYEEWLETKDDRILNDIERYNEVDCWSLQKLQVWLEKLRQEAEAKFGITIPRPEHRDPEPSQELSEAEAETRELVAALTENIPVEPQERTKEQQAQWLLAQLLGWHRREARVQWWFYFELLKKNENELMDNSEAIGGLRYEGVVDTIRQSAIHRYHFDPSQDHKIKEGDIPIDPATQKSAGTVYAIDSVKGVIDLKRGLKNKAPHPNALIPGQPIDTRVLRQAIMRVAKWVIENGIDAEGPYRAVRDLLMAVPPRLNRHKQGEALVQQNEEASDKAREFDLLLADSYLPIQGPPGAGKTYTGARMIVDLVKKGKQVGITATSHKAIGNLLKEVCRYAPEAGVKISAIQKASEGQKCEAEGIRYTSGNEEVETAIHGKQVNVVAGTPWLFARPELDGSLDDLFIDEAAQMSLANTVAVGGAANNLILLGDPCQLAQPSQGSHPPGAEKSSLEHLLREHATVPKEQGLFLDKTWRLHPNICKFISEIVYEGRLESETSCANQSVSNGSGLSGTGLRFLPINHHGNRTSSTEEAERLKAELKKLIGKEWTDSKGSKKFIKLEDILVVAPYNAQVARIVAYLPSGSRVGTVDKFQGQEAPVVFYSMASSTTEDIPRGLDFLFSLNRLNVAVSRARGLAVLVCSPNLFRVRCRSPKDMRLVNAFCRFVECVS